jgi:hypothetical protein
LRAEVVGGPEVQETAGNEKSRGRGKKSRVDDEQGGDGPKESDQGEN